MTLLHHGVCRNYLVTVCFEASSCRFIWENKNAYLFPAIVQTFPLNEIAIENHLSVAIFFILDEDIFEDFYWLKNTISGCLISYTVVY